MILRRARCVLALSGAFLACTSTGTSNAPAPTAPLVLPTKPSAEQTANADRLLSGNDWYRYAVFYEINVRSFQDSNGDGIGDLAGVTSKLDYLKDLGVDAIWLMPVYPTPFVDSGYDISDYEGINPDYGTMADFDKLVSEAHARKIRLFMDLVLNHTSDKHAWFTESRADKTNAKADWYVWSDTPSRADIGSCKPDTADFGNGWQLDPPRNQYYFHRFFPGQPDLNYRNADVVAATLDVPRFWMDKGVDGFRCDVIGKLYESPDGCDMLPENVEYIKKLRKVLDAKAGSAMVAEASSADYNDTTKYYGNGSDMFHMTFNFAYGYFWGIAFSQKNRQIIEDAINTQNRYPEGSQAAQVIGSHDVLRAWTSAGGDAARYRNGALVEMTLKGTPFIYYGEEVGLRPGTTQQIDLRDKARTPMTWTKDANGYGFSTGKPWIPFGEAPDATNVETEDADPKSMLTYYRQLLAFRRGHAVWGTGTARVIPFDLKGVIGYVREDKDESYLVAVNMSDDVAETTATEPLPTSGPLVFGEGTLKVSGGTVSLKLPASGAAIFKLR